MGWCASITSSIRSSTTFTPRSWARTGRPSVATSTTPIARCRFRSRRSARPASRCGPAGRGRIWWVTWRPGRRSGRSSGRWGRGRSRRSGVSLLTLGAPMQQVDRCAGPCRSGWASCKAVTRAGPTAFSNPTFAGVTPRKRTTPHAPPPELAAPFRTSEDLFRLMVENVQDYAIFMLDVGGRVATWNKGAERIKGYSAEEIIGQHFSRFYPPEDVQARKPERELQEAVAEGQWEDEGWRVRKDGSRFWANVIITALRDAEGTPLGFAKLTRDLTERRRADAVHRQNEERLRLMVDSVKDFAIIMLDSEGRVIRWNAGAERTHGYRGEEILGRHFSRFYPPEDVAQGKPEWELERAARDGQLEDEGWRVRKDGSRFWGNVVITSIRDAQRALVGFAKVTRDATERRRAEAEIRRQRGFTEQLINSSTDGILGFDRECRYTLWSEGMARISGVAAEEVSGRPALEVFPFFKDTGEDKHYVAALEGRKVTAEGGRYSAREPAAHVVLEAQYSPLVGDSGQIVGGLAIVRDVTERKRVEEELARSNAELEKFSYSVSHDLRAPLRAIDGFARALHEDYGSALNGDGQRMIGVIRDNAQRMGQLIDALLNFSRAGRQQLVTTSVDLTALAQSVVDELRRTAGGVAVEATVHPLPSITGDATLLRQVLVNLIGNALKFSRNRAQPRVDIAARQEGDG